MSTFSKKYATLFLPEYRFDFQIWNYVFIAETF